MSKVGLHWATEQCRDLLDNQVRGIHFYTLNRSDATRQIYQNLGVKDSGGLEYRPIESTQGKASRRVAALSRLLQVRDPAARCRRRLVRRSPLSPWRGLIWKPTSNLVGGASCRHVLPGIDRSPQSRSDRLGFDQVGIAPAVVAPGYPDFLRWLDAGYSAGMDYLKRQEPGRSNPDTLLEGVRSIVMVSVVYGSNHAGRGAEPTSPVQGRVGALCRVSIIIGSCGITWDCSSIG